VSWSVAESQLTEYLFTALDAGCEGLMLKLLDGPGGWVGGYWWEHCSGGVCALLLVVDFSMPGSMLQQCRLRGHRKAASCVSLLASHPWSRVLVSFALVPTPNPHTHTHTATPPRLQRLATHPPSVVYRGSS
jgi:hypothetical protein